MTKTMTFKSPLLNIIFVLLLVLSCNSEKSNAGLVKNIEAFNQAVGNAQPIVNFLNNNFYKSEKTVVSGDQKYTIENLWELNPKFVEGTYKLSEKSELKRKATDGSNLGIITKN